MTDKATIIDLSGTPAPTTPVDQLVFLKGYYNTGDGGEGHFYWDASLKDADNGGTIIRPKSVSTTSAGRWVRMFKDEVHVKWFGAKGDSVMLKDGKMIAGLNTLTCESASFDNSYVGKPVTVSGVSATETVLKATIVAFISPKQVKISLPASATVSAAWIVIYFTNDNTVINNAISFAAAKKIRLLLDDGVYNISNLPPVPPATTPSPTPLTLKSDSYILGANKDSAVLVSYNDDATNNYSLSLSGGSNLTLKSFTVYNCNPFNISRVDKVIIDELNVIDSIATAIYVFNCKRVLIKNCFVNFHAVGSKTTTVKKKMGIRVEGASGAGCVLGLAEDIIITNNIIHNAYDNAIAVRAIQGNLRKSIVSNNSIFNAGKAAIKNTIEVSSYANVELQELIISNNVIHGWASYVYESGIDASSFLQVREKSETDPCYEVKSDEIRPVSNVAISGNTVRAYHPIDDNGISIFNDKQTSYINALDQLNSAITANVCTGGVSKSGISGYITKNLILTGNILEDACQGGMEEDDLSTSGGLKPINLANYGGITLNNIQHAIITGNTVKNTAKRDLSGSVYRPSIFLTAATRCLVSGNICFDDRGYDPAYAPTPYNSGLYELDVTGSDTHDNTFGGNVNYGFMKANVYTRRSMVYDSTPVIIATPDGANNFTMDAHTTFLILPQITGTVNQRLTLPTPVSTEKLNFIKLTVWNKNTGSPFWFLKNPVYKGINNIDTTTTISQGIVNFSYDFTSSKWLQY